MSRNWLATTLEVKHEIVRAHASFRQNASLDLMATWTQFTADAPRVSAIFTRRHAATGKLCMLATLRADGFPRISPMEPQIFEDRLLLIGMPGTRKFEDLRRDPRLSLHTATVDTMVSDGDAKLWGTALDISGETAIFERFAEHLFAESGMDLRGVGADHFYEIDIAGASSVEVVTAAGGQAGVAADVDHLAITVWKPGAPERVTEKR